MGCLDRFDVKIQAARLNSPALHSFIAQRPVE